MKRYHRFHFDVDRYARIVDLNPGKWYLVNNTLFLIRSKSYYGVILRKSKQLFFKSTTLKMYFLCNLTLRRLTKLLICLDLACSIIFHKIDRTGKKLFVVIIIIFKLAVGCLLLMYFN